MRSLRGVGRGRWGDLAVRTGGHRRRFAAKPAVIFDSPLKALHRERAAAQPAAEEHDYIHDAVAAELVSRLYDISRDFPVAVDAGCRRGHVWGALDESRRENGRVPGGVKTLLQARLAPRRRHVIAAPAPRH